MSGGDSVTGDVRRRVLQHPLVRYAAARGFLEKNTFPPSKEVFQGEFTLMGKTWRLSNIREERLWTLFVEYGFNPVTTGDDGNPVAMTQGDLNKVTARPKVSVLNADDRIRYVLSLIRKGGALPSLDTVSEWARSSQTLLQEASKADRIIRASVMKWFDPVTRARKPGYESRVVYWKQRLEKSRLGIEELTSQLRDLQRQFAAELAERDTDMRLYDANWKGRARTQADLRALMGVEEDSPSSSPPPSLPRDPAPEFVVEDDDELGED